jgi:tripartite-type tricarboxylate transporter receptor subunit TctC
VLLTLRLIVRLLAALLIGGALTGAPSAQTSYPNRPVRVIIPFGPGGFADITMRLVGEKLSERIGQQVVIENKPSAGGIIAGSVVSSAQPDGYTLFVLTSGMALSKALLKTMPFDPDTAFLPVSTLAQFDLLVLVKSESSIRTVNDALAQARTDPAKFNIGTISPGSTQNVTGELFRATTGVPMTIIPYRTTGEVLTSLLRGDTQIAIDTYAALKPAIDAGSIRAIAATGDTRSPMQPNVPTLKESNLNFTVFGWNALAAPAGTPKDVVAFLNRHIREIVESPDITKRMLDLGGEAKASTPEELGARFHSDIAMWADVVKKAGLEPQ